MKHVKNFNTDKINEGFNPPSFEIAYKAVQTVLTEWENERRRGGYRPYTITSEEEEVLIKAMDILSKKPEGNF